MTDFFLPGARFRSIRIPQKVVFLAGVLANCTLSIQAVQADPPQEEGSLIWIPAEIPGWLAALIGAVLALIGLRMLRSILADALVRGISEGIQAIGAAVLNDLKKEYSWKDLFEQSLHSLQGTWQQFLQDVVQEIRPALNRYVDSQLEKPLPPLHLALNDPGEKISSQERFADDALTSSLREVEDTLEANEPYQAIERLQELCDAHPEDARPFIELARVRLSVGQYEQARDLLLLHADRFPEHAIYQRTLGLAHQQLDELDKALAAKQRSAELAPGDPSAYTAIAYTFWRMQKIEQAIRQTEKAIQLAEAASTAPENLARIRNSLAYYLAEKKRAKDKEKALELIRSALEVEKVPFYYDTLGYVLMRFGDTIPELDEATEAITTAMKLGYDEDSGAEKLRQIFKLRNSLQGRAGEPLPNR